MVVYVHDVHRATWSVRHRKLFAMHKGFTNVGYNYKQELVTCLPKNESNRQFTSMPSSTSSMELCARLGTQWSSDSLALKIKSCLFSCSVDTAVQCYFSRIPSESQVTRLQSDQQSTKSMQDIHVE